MTAIATIRQAKVIATGVLGKEVISHYNNKTSYGRRIRIWLGEASSAQGRKVVEALKSEMGIDAVVTCDSASHYSPGIVDENGDIGFAHYVSFRIEEA